MAFEDAQLAPHCYRCGYALAGLDCGPCPECGARDITVAHDRVRARTIANRAPGGLVLCSVLGVLLTIVRVVLLVTSATPPPSAIPLVMFAVLCLAPGAMLWHFVSSTGLMRTMTPANFEGRCIWYNLAGTLGSWPPSSPGSRPRNGGRPTEAAGVLKLGARAPRTHETMGDEVSILASERLRRYLAENDVICDGCGANLRGVTTVECPRCARIIESPYRRFSPATVAGICHRCGYMLHGLNVAVCPECGATDITVGDIEARLARGQCARVPRFLKLCGGCGSVLLLWNLLMLPVLGMPRTAHEAQFFLIPFLAALTPGALVVVVYLYPGMLVAERPSAAFARRAGAYAVAAALVALAVALARTE